MKWSEEKVIHIVYNIEENWKEHQKLKFFFKHFFSFLKFDFFNNFLTFNLFYHSLLIIAYTPDFIYPYELMWPSYQAKLSDFISQIGRK